MSTEAPVPIERRPAGRLQLQPEPLRLGTLATREEVNVVATPGHTLTAFDARAAVEDVMQTDVTSVAPTTSLDEVVALMLQSGLRFVPVCENGRLMGVITNGDLVDRAGLVARLELQASLGDAAGIPPVIGMTAADVLTPDPVAVLVGTTLGEVARLMLSRRVKRIPVLRAGRVVGIVSRYDLLRSIAGATEAADIRAAHPGVARSAGSPTVAGDVAVRTVPTVRRDTPLAEVVDVLISTRLNRALVVDDEHHVLGVVSDAELLRRVGPAGRHLIDRLMRRGGHADVAGVCADVMIPSPGLVQASAPVSEAVREMISRGSKILPVVDDQQRLVGMLDRSDVLRAAFAVPRDGE